MEDVLAEKGGALRILLVDDEEIVRHGLARLLEAEEVHVAVESVATVGEAVDALGRAEHDVVLLDINIPGIGGVEGINIIRRQWPDLPIVMLTAMATEEKLRDCLQHGACGFLTKDLAPDVILSRLRDAVSGEYVFGVRQKRQLVERYLHSVRHACSDDDFSRAWRRLGRRYVGVANLIARGLSTKEIAAKLYLSTNTVRMCSSEIYASLGCASRAQFIYRYWRSGVGE